jgi:exosortase A
MSIRTNAAPMAAAQQIDAARMPFEHKVAFATALVVVALVLGIFADVAKAMVATWLSSSTFGHGPLIPVLAASLIWRRRDRLAAAEPRFDWLGLLAVLFALAVMITGRISATTVIQQFGLVFILQACVFCVLGRDVVRRLLFPLAYLIFAVPFGAELVPPLQDITAFFVVVLLRVCGIPVFIDGVFITTPVGNYLVAEACSGLRYLISTTTLSLVFANLALHSWQRRAMFMVLALLIPVVANGIRAFLIVLIAYLSNNELATGIDHVIYGWVFFSFVTCILFGVGFAMRDAQDEPRIQSSPPAIRSFAAPILGAMVILALSAGASRYASAITNAAAEIDPSRIAVPALPGFERVATKPNDWKPLFLAPDRQIDQTYLRGDRQLDLHIGLYSHERPGAKAITDAHDFSVGDAWSLGEIGSAYVTLPDHQLKVASVRLSAGGHYRWVWYWYWVAGEFTGSSYVAKWLQFRSRLTGGDPAIAVVAISTEYRPVAGEPTDLLREALMAMPAIGDTIERVVRHGAAQPPAGREANQP